MNTEHETKQTQQDREAFETILEKQQQTLEAMVQTVREIESEVALAMKHKDMLDELRRFLKTGATIKATDPVDAILTLQEDGSWYGGLTIEGARFDWPEGQPVDRTVYMFGPV